MNRDFRLGWEEDSLPLSRVWGGRRGGEERVDGERWVGILFENDSASEFSKEDLGNWLKTMMDS